MRWLGDTERSPCDGTRIVRSRHERVVAASVAPAFAQLPVRGSVHRMTAWAGADEPRSTSVQDLGEYEEGSTPWKALVMSGALLQTSGTRS